MRNDQIKLRGLNTGPKNRRVTLPTMHHITNIMISLIQGRQSQYVTCPNCRKKHLKVLLSLLKTNKVLEEAVRNPSNRRGTLIHPEPGKTWGYYMIWYCGKISLKLTERNGVESTYHGWGGKLGKPPFWCFLHSNSYCCQLFETFNPALKYAVIIVDSCIDLPTTLYNLWE